MTRFDSRDTGRSAGNSNTVSYCKEWARLVFAGTAAKCKLPCAGGRMIIRCSKPAGPRKGAASLGSEYFRLRPRLPVPGLVPAARSRTPSRSIRTQQWFCALPWRDSLCAQNIRYTRVAVQCSQTYRYCTRVLVKISGAPGEKKANWSISYFPFSYIAPFA